MVAQCPSCDQNGGPASDSLTHMYVNFIRAELLPQLISLASKYAVWWTFKPDSLLKSYLNDREIYMEKYFRPDELLEQVLNILKNSTQFSNNSVIVLNDEELQRVFNTYFIHVPDLIQENLLPHIVPAPEEISHCLQDKIMTDNFYVTSPVDIIYKDPSSVFWLTPVVDFAINKSTGNVNSWSKLLSVFTEFCTTNNECLTRHGDTILEIRENTFLNDLFDFKFFHISQIETILKSITKFLGRKNGLNQSCPLLKHISMYKQSSCNKFTDVLMFIDDVVNNNNNLMPYVPLGLHI